MLGVCVVRYGGEDVIQGGCHVVAYEEFKDAAGKKRVAAILEDGRRVEGDVLVGTDGIWSKIRKQLLGDAPAHYSEYTCYTVSTATHTHTHTHARAAAPPCPLAGAQVITSMCLHACMLQ